MKNLLILVIFSVSIFVAHGSDLSNKKGKKKKKKDEKKEVKKDDKKYAEDVIKGYTKYDGLFPIYRDTTTGEALLQINLNQLDKNYLYFGYTENGVVGAGHNKGSFRSTRIFTIEKDYEKLAFIEKNTRFYFDEENEISKASNANISNSILFKDKIKYISKDGDYFLIDADKLYLKEVFQQIKPSPQSGGLASLLGNKSLLGKLDGNKTSYHRIKNYPENTDVQVTYTFSQSYPQVGAGRDITDTRNISITFQHSIIELKESNYKPRFDDQRVGYFTTQVNDMTSLENANFRDFIHRWNLEKKNPEEKISEPVKPIVYWIENTTPKELRPTIKAAGEQWNIAFEAAGFKNAFIIKEQPDDADWDAGDIRYNVIRWTSSPYPPFGGYGPSLANPLTGEIIAADIMLEWVYIANRVDYNRLFNSPSADHDFDHLPFDIQEVMDEKHCMAGHYSSYNNVFAQAAAKATNLSDEVKKQLIKESLTRLVLHEIGHTLGLNHNMRASQLHNTEKINDEALTKQVGLTGSVMDYPAINISPDPEKQGQFYDTRPGPYDIWAIQFGYTPSLDDPTEEAKRMDKLLSRSTDPNLAFGNDADDMRSIGTISNDPRVMIFDLGKDAVDYSIGRLELCNTLDDKLVEKYQEDGATYHDLSAAYFTVQREQSIHSGILARYIGGIYTNRHNQGTPNADKPFVPVEYSLQKKAMNGLTKYTFSPTSLIAPKELYQHIQLQRRGFNFFSSRQDPDITRDVLSTQKAVLGQLLSSNTINRIIDSELYGNKYAINEMMTDLTDAIFKADLSSSLSLTRQNLQVEYVTMLLNASGMNKTGKSSYSNIAKAQAYHQIDRIKTWMRTYKLRGDATTQAHRKYIQMLIDKALNS